MILKGTNGDAIRLTKLGMALASALFGLVLTLGGWTLKTTQSNEMLLERLLERIEGLPARVTELEKNVARIDGQVATRVSP